MVCSDPALDVLRTVATEWASLETGCSLDFGCSDPPGARRNHSGFHPIFHTLCRSHALALLDRGGVRIVLFDLGLQRAVIYGAISLGIRGWNRQSSLPSAAWRCAGSGAVFEAGPAARPVKGNRVPSHSRRKLLSDPQRFERAIARCCGFFTDPPRSVLNGIVDEACEAKLAGCSDRRVGTPFGLRFLLSSNRT